VVTTQVAEVQVVGLLLLVLEVQAVVAQVV
jgi:hypothetical protein